MSVGHPNQNSAQANDYMAAEHERETRSVKMRMILSTVVMIAALALAPAAMADSSSVGTYGGQGGEVAGSVASASDPASQSSSLPFTGLDVGLMAGGGALLLLIGLTMARTVPRNRDV